MADVILDYQKMTQDALRGVVRAALEVAVKDGLPGEHHFFISFSTGAPGVNISSRLRERHPEEMTIVLQHQFWGLEVTAENFTIKLSFNNISETLVVPFTAVKGFLDPSVQFGLQFETAPGKKPGTDMIPVADKPQTVAGAHPPVEEAKTDAVTEITGEITDDTETPETAGVISLDAFRKK